MGDKSKMSHNGKLPKSPLPVREAFKRRVRQHRDSVDRYLRHAERCRRKRCESVKRVSEVVRKAKIVVADWYGRGLEESEVEDLRNALSALTDVDPSAIYPRSIMSLNTVLERLERDFD